MVRDLHNGTSTLVLVLTILGIATAARLATAQQPGVRMYDASLILHSFANDATGALQALPLGAYCNPANGGSMCLTETLLKGAPLTGMGQQDITGSAPFSLEFTRARLRRRTSGSLPPYPGLSYTLTSANLRNDAGTLRPGSGPGSFSFVPALGAGSTRVAVVAGKNQFGGVMGLIGEFGTQIAGSTSGGGTWHGNFPTWGVSVIGASYAKTAMITGSITFPSLSLSYPSVAVVTGFPWTTGRVSVEAAGGYGFQTALVRSGYDNRTEFGGGTIQLVAPSLTHWSGGAHWGSIAILNVKLVPEPKAWLMLVAGLGFLSVLYHRHIRAPRAH